MKRESQRTQAERVRGELVALLAFVESRAEEKPIDSTIRTDTEDDLGLASSDAVSNWLYRTWYTGETGMQNTDNKSYWRDTLVPLLRASHAAFDRWQQGWVALQSSPDGACIVGFKDWKKELSPGEYANISRPGLPPSPGDNLATSELTDWVDRETGFWCAQSFSGPPSQPIVRAYWSSSWKHVGRVVREVTTDLEQLEVKYSLKCPLKVEQYSRVDSLVVYLEKASWSAVSARLRKTASRLEPYLRGKVPPLTKQLAAGFAMAEDPGGQQSFGESRCRALAPAVVSIWRNKAMSSDAKLEMLLQAILSSGIDPERPWKRMDSARSA